MSQTHILKLRGRHRGQNSRQTHKYTTSTRTARPPPHTHHTHADAHTQRGIILNPGASFLFFLRVIILNFRDSWSSLILRESRALIFAPHIDMLAAGPWFRLILTLGVSFNSDPGCLRLAAQMYTTRSRFGSKPLRPTTAAPCPPRPPQRLPHGAASTPRVRKRHRCPPIINGCQFVRMARSSQSSWHSRSGSAKHVASDSDSASSESREHQEPLRAKEEEDRRPPEVR